jgi:hypothetical protein
MMLLGMLSVEHGFSKIDTAIGGRHLGSMLNSELALRGHSSGPD